MKKIMKRIGIFALILITATNCSVIVEAKKKDNGKKITASSKSVYHKEITKTEANVYPYLRKGYYKFGANGYTTAEARHSTTVELHDGITGVLYKSSGRRIGTGYVAADTGYDMDHCWISYDSFLHYATLYYNFDV